MRRTAAILIAALAALVSGCSVSKPIAEQNCHELAATYRHLAEVIRDHPIGRDATGRQAMRDAEALNLRVSAQGGCPNEPGLQ